MIQNNIKNNDISLDLQQQVLKAIQTGQPLNIHGGNSKKFYGNFSPKLEEAEPLNVSSHTGVVDYDPTELAITVRAGTRLKDLEELLAKNNQILPFEPPYYSEDTTIGGAIASGISGPRRAYTGSARDSILGVQIINGKGEIANFGGQVMKNVAGYDLSRLMVRSLGTLGVILNVSLRLLPKPEHEITLVFESSQEDALAHFQLLRKKQNILSATAWYKQQSYLRLSGTEQTVNHQSEKLLGSKKIESTQTETELSNEEAFWSAIRDHKHPFFAQDDKPLWRLSFPPATPVTQEANDLLIEWGGAQRWMYSNTPTNIIHDIAKKHGGYATMMKAYIPEASFFSPLEPALFKLHQQLKNQMDPHGIFNPGRLYENL